MWRVRRFAGAARGVADSVNVLHTAGRRIVGLDLPGIQRHSLVDLWDAGSVLDQAVLDEAVPTGGTVVRAAVGVDRQLYDRVAPSVATNVAGTYLVLDAAQARQARPRSRHRCRVGQQRW